MQGVRKVDIPPAIASQKWRVVRIATREERGFAFRGTGFALARANRTLVIANEHTIRKVRAELGQGAEIWVGFRPPLDAHRAMSVEADPVHDVAILEVGVQIEGETQERIGEARVGTPVLVLGYDDQHTRADDLVMSRGIVKWVGPYVVAKDMLITSGTYPGPTTRAVIIDGVRCESGASGSPLFDEGGRIMGFLKGHTDRGECFAISISAVIGKTR